MTPDRHQKPVITEIWQSGVNLAYAYELNSLVAANGLTFKRLPDQSHESVWVIALGAARFRAA
jgi:hypothetical protein